MSENKSLVDLALQAAQVEQALLENNGELTPELEEQLENIELALPHKLDSYVHIIERMNFSADYWKAKAAQMSAIAKSCENIGKRLKGNIHYAMTAAEKVEVEGHDYRWKMIKSKARLELVGEVPDEFMKEKVVREVDKEKVLAALGDEVGAQLAETRIVEETGEETHRIWAQLAGGSYVRSFPRKTINASVKKTAKKKKVKLKGASNG